MEEKVIFFPLLRNVAKKILVDCKHMLDSPGHSDVVKVESGHRLRLVVSPTPCGTADQPAATRGRLLMQLVTPIHGGTVHTEQLPVTYHHCQSYDLSCSANIVNNPQASPLHYPHCSQKSISCYNKESNELKSADTTLPP